MFKSIHRLKTIILRFVGVNYIKLLWEKLINFVEKQIGMTFIIGEN